MSRGSTAPSSGQGRYCKAAKCVNGRETTVQRNCNVRRSLQTRPRLRALRLTAHGIGRNQSSFEVEPRQQVGQRGDVVRFRDRRRRRLCVHRSSRAQQPPPTPCAPSPRAAPPWRRRRQPARHAEPGSEDHPARIWVTANRTPPHHVTIPPPANRPRDAAPSTPPTRASPLTPAHTAALHPVLHIVHTTGVWYRATGGLAGNVHGSAWPLHDIDLDIPRDEGPTVAPALAPWLVQPLAPYADDEFRIAMAVARIDGIDIEFCPLDPPGSPRPPGG